MHNKILYIRLLPLLCPVSYIVLVELSVTSISLKRLRMVRARSNSKCMSPRSADAWQTINPLKAVTD